jgi:hypothetical protein
LTSIWSDRLILAIEPIPPSANEKQQMLTEQAIRETSRRRAWVILPAMTCAAVAAMLYFVGVGQFREALISFAVDQCGESARDITPIVLILPAFLLFLLPTLAAASYADRFKTICPSCEKDISNRTFQLLTTRCCPYCEHNILAGGRIRSAGVYRRYQSARWRSFLKYWLWAWPVLGLLCLVWWLFDQSALQQCPQCYWLAPLIGTAASGWAWVRTFDRRYLPSLLASIVLLGVGVTIFRRAI